LRSETGVAWELGVTYHIRFYALVLCGEWKRCGQELPGLLREARERGDLATACRLQIHASYLSIAADQPDRARQSLAEALQQFGLKGGFHLQHQQALVAEAETALYAGEFDQAWAVIDQHWPALQESLLLSFQEIRMRMHHIRARCALAAAFGSGVAARPASNPDLVQSYAVPSARLIRATIAFRQGRLREAVTLLEAAAVEYHDVDMHGHAAAVRWQLGLLLGADLGQALMQEAKAYMTDQGIRNPARLLHIFTPGFPAAE
jgi:eukaryotic-like serine/threonine-protein kinase